MKITLQESQAISKMRFPLAFLVVLWHTPHIKPQPFAVTGISFCQDDLIRLAKLVIENSVMISVPVFFLISGYLFFKGIVELDKSIWYSKLRSRCRSLLVPYLLWNSYAVLFVVFVKIVSVIFMGKPINVISQYLTDSLPNAFWVYETRILDEVNLLGCHLMEFTPINVPLWFIRDLFVITFFSPLVFLLIKRCGGIFILILIILYLTGIWPQLPGLEVRAALFFSLGGYFALKNKQMCINNGRNNIWFYVITFCILTLSIYIGEPWLRRLFALVGAISFIQFFIQISENQKRDDDKLKICSDAVFFIYAMHTVSIIYLIKNLLSNFIGTSEVSDLISYILTPIIVVGVIVFIYVLFRKYMNRLCLLLSGGR